MYNCEVFKMRIHSLFFVHCNVLRVNHKGYNVKELYIHYISGVIIKNQPYRRQILNILSKQEI